MNEISDILDILEDIVSELEDVKNKADPLANPELKAIRDKIDRLKY